MSNHTIDMTKLKAEALRDAARLMRRRKATGHWNLTDPFDPECAYSPDRWLEVLADHLEREANAGASMVQDRHGVVWHEQDGRWYNGDPEAWSTREVRSLDSLAHWFGPLVEVAK